MRRITLWVLSTLSALVLLFSYSTSTSGPQATRAPSSIYSSSSSGPSTAESTGGTGASEPSSGPTPSGSSTSGDKSVTGSVAQTQWGPVQVQLKVSNGKITDVSVIQYPNGNGKDQEINSQALPVLTQETVDAQSADIDMVSGATVTSNGYLESLQSALDQAGLVSSRAPEAQPMRGIRRKVAHVMGMPISLALRGLHVDDDRAESAWQDVLASLSEADRVFSTYRSDSAISRLQRREIDLVDCPPEVREVLDLGERARIESGGFFDVRRRGPGGHTVLDPSGVVKGWAVDRAARRLDALPQTDYCLSAGGDMLCRTKRSGAPAWRIGIEDPHDPRRVIAVVPVHDGAVATSGLAHRGAHIVDARTGVTPTGIASVTVVGPDLVRADIDATAAFARDVDALTWLHTRPDHSGLVVWADGVPETFGKVTT